MAFLLISGDPASRWEEAAHGVSQLLAFELITETRMEGWIAEEFGDVVVPDRAWRPAVVSILARMAAEHHLVVALPCAELLFTTISMVFRVAVTAPEARRVGNVMVDRRLDRTAAREALLQLEADAKRARKARFGRPPAKTSVDLVVNTAHLDTRQICEIVRSSVAARGLVEEGLLSTSGVAQLQFQTRLELAGHGIVPAGHASLKKPSFGHPSEQLFANLLDFYGIQWEYEPRSFSLQWDKGGNVTEAFTPDFYLPELDLYLELTTMKQALVTRKNRKIKLLRAIYPHVNIQVFYQKDFQDLIFKYGLPARAAMP